MVDFGKIYGWGLILTFLGSIGLAIYVKGGTRESFYNKAAIVADLNKNRVTSLDEWREFYGFFGESIDDSDFNARRDFTSNIHNNERMSSLTRWDLDKYDEIARNRRRVLKVYEEALKDLRKK